MNETRIESIEFDYNHRGFMCRYCQTKMTPENEALPRISCKENEILNLKQQIQNLQAENERLKQEQKLFQIELQDFKSRETINATWFGITKVNNITKFVSIYNFNLLNI